MLGRSIMVCVSTLGTCMISWFNNKQATLALSLAKAVYISTFVAYCEAVWLLKLIIELTDEMLEPPLVYGGNWNCVRLFENPLFLDHSKHIDI